MKVTGTVYQSTGSWYKVKLSDGKWCQCRLKGKMRLDDLKTTNPIAVGDEVEIEYDEQGKNPCIASVLKRDNYIIRNSPRNARKNHIIASNIDQSFLVCSLRYPKTRLGFIDRFLVSCEMYHVEAHLLFNKADVWRDEDFGFFEELKELYEPLGYPVHMTIAGENRGIEKLLPLLEGKRTLVSGQSGVGKSTLLNCIDPSLNITTKEVSNYNDKGQHTTTFATMYDLDGSSGLGGGEIIDTPGIKLFKLIDLDKNEVGHYFPEIRARMQDCKFDNCTHFNEPKCAVQAALDKGEIAEHRFVSYYNIFNESSEQNHWS